MRNGHGTNDSVTTSQEEGATTSPVIATATSTPPAATASGPTDAPPPATASGPTDAPPATASGPTDAPPATASGPTVAAPTALKKNVKQACVNQHPVQNAQLNGWQTGAGLSDWLDGNNCIRADLLQKLLPPGLSATSPQASHEWDTMHMDGHQITVPRELRRGIHQWKSHHRLPKGVPFAAGVDRNLDAANIRPYCLPLAGQIVSGSWWNSLREAPLSVQECHNILERIKTLKSPLADYCRDGVDVDCEALYGAGGAGHYKRIEKNYHEVIPKPEHDGGFARQRLEDFHKEVVKRVSGG